MTAAVTAALSTFLHTKWCWIPLSSLNYRGRFPEGKAPAVDRRGACPTHFPFPSSDPQLTCRWRGHCWLASQYVRFSRMGGSVAAGCTRPSASMARETTV